MLNRMATGLFHHKYLGMYQKDKTIRIILYVIMLLLIVSIPGFIALSTSNVMDNKEFDEIEYVLEKNQKEAIISNYELNISEVFYIETNAYIYSFGEHPVATQKLCFEYTYNSLNVYLFGIKLGGSSYQELNLENLVISNDFSYNDINNIILSCEKVGNDNILEIKLIYCIFYFLDNILYYGILFLAMFLLAGFINKKVKGKIKYVICAYSLTSAVILDLFYVLSGIRIFNILGVLLSFVCLYRALKVIILVKVKRGEQ